MATTLNTITAFYTLSSAIQDMTWDTDAETLAVRVVGGQVGTIFSTELSAHGGAVRLWETRNLIEKTMIERQLPFMTVNVQWRENATSPWMTEQFQVIFCAMVTGEEAGYLAMNHFLTTARVKLLPPPEGQETLPLFNVGFASLQPKYSITAVVPDGSMVTVDINGSSSNQNMGVWNVPVDMASIRSMAAVWLLDYPEFEIVRMVVRVGNRRMTYIRPNPLEQPALVLVYLNAFNAPEWARLYGKTTVKTSNSAKLASVAREKVKYDHDLETVHEFESAPLTEEDARQLQQLVCSPQVWLEDGTPVVIDTDSHEWNDGENELQQLKFSWRRADGRAAMRDDLPEGGPFNPVYNETYQ